MIFSLLQLIASSIIADNARNYKDSGICDGWRAVSGAIDCNNLVVAAVSSGQILSSKHVLNKQRRSHH